MTVKIWSKPVTQKIIRALRKEGYTVHKGNGMYTVLDEDTGGTWKGNDGKPIFRAMNMGSSYMVTYDPYLFQGFEDESI